MDRRAGRRATAGSSPDFVVCGTIGRNAPWSLGMVTKELLSSGGELEAGHPQMSMRFSPC